MIVLSTFSKTVHIYNIMTMVMVVYYDSGTHDFQDISISSPSAGVVRVTGRFVEGSPATGVLVIVSGDSGVTYHMSSRRGSGNHAVTIPGLAGGDYTVSVFVVEENGLPFERAAIVPEHLSVVTSENA